MQEWDKEANYVEFDEEEPMLLMIQAETLESKREGVWSLDSSCSNHMSGNRTWFLFLDESFKQFRRLGNKTKMKVEGVTHIVTDVFYVFYVTELKKFFSSPGHFQKGGSLYYSSQEIARFIILREIKSLKAECPRTKYLNSFLLLPQRKISLKEPISIHQMKMCHICGTADMYT